MMSLYPLDSAWRQARDRLAQLEAWHDRRTIAVLERVGVGPGWRCLEAGAGGGSIAAWLCQQVGPNGRVLATDIDTRLLTELDEPNLTVLRHDLGADALPEAAFDLVHERALLQWVPDHERALDHLIAALKPGGWLVLEDQAGWPEVTSRPAEPPVAELWARRNRAMAMLNPKAELGRRLGDDLAARGLEAIQSEIWFERVRGTDAHARFSALNLQQTHDRLVATGHVTGEELDTIHGWLADPDFVYWSWPMAGTWACKPTA